MNNISPEHYKVGGLEVIDIWKAKLTQEEFRGACKANILKYVLRGDYKGGVEDYCKARTYLNWLIESYDEKETSKK